jgi:hypothetical protein
MPTRIDFLLGVFTLCAALSAPQNCLAEESASTIVSIVVNGKTLSPTFEVMSPRISLELDYIVTEGQKFEWLRIYRGSGCSLKEPNYQASWCEGSPCIIGENQEFDISFESKDNYYYIFKPVEKSLEFSVELATKDNVGVRETTCRNAQIKFTPCDEILKEEFSGASAEPVKLMFFDKITKKPIPNVQILLSSGPIAQFNEIEPGVVEMPTIARSGYKLSISRDGKRRFVAGPYNGQLSDNRLKSLQIALCSAD